MKKFYVWAACDRATSNRVGDVVPDGRGAYLYATETLSGACEAMVKDPATYETADGETAPLFIAESENGERPRIVTGPHTGSAWPMPYAPKRYRPELSAFVSLAGEFACDRCGADSATALDGGDVIVCGGCV